MPDEIQTTERWPPWAAELIALHGSYRGGITTSVAVPRNVFDYIVWRTQREQLDAMLDAEIGARPGDQ